MSTNDLELGPCEVLFGTAGAEAEVGPTEGGVVANFGTDVQDLMTDQFGTSPKDQVVSGQPTEVTVPFASISFSNMARALNQTLITAGTSNLIKGTNIVGTKMSTKANSLVLKKIINGVASVDQNDWLRFPSAAPTGNFEFPFSKDTQRIIEVVFTCFPDSSSNLYYIGDERAG